MRGLLTAALTSHVMDDPKPVGAALWRKVREVLRETSDVSRLETWARQLPPADGSAVLGRLELLEPMEKLLAQLSSEGIEVVTEFDDAYPQRLLKRLNGKHPAMFFVAGAVSLLTADSVGVVGSRDVDDVARTFAHDVASEAVSLGLAIVSGGARGIDLESMRAALDAGGSTVGFMADSMVKLARRPQMLEFLEDGRVCLASPYSPSAGFSVGNAMARNKYIYAHSLATVVVSSAAETGGTWAGATEALKNKFCPVFVRMGADVPEGNPRLVRLGGVPLEKAGELGALLERQSPPTEGAIVQGTLF